MILVQKPSFELDLDPQQLASVGLDRPLLKLRLMPRRRRVIATAPGGGGTPPPTGGGIVTVPLHERQNGIGINQPIESGGGLPQLPNGVGGGTQPLLPERDRRIPQQLTEELHHLMAMVVVMVIVMVVEEVIDHLPQEEMAMMMEMVMEMIHHHLLIMDSQDIIKVKEIDGCMLFKDHLDLQVNLDKMVEMVVMDMHHSYPEE